MKKNEDIIVDIIDNGFQGEGIAKKDGITIFINGAIKGEKAKIKILKVSHNIAYGKILEIIEKSEYRRQSDCETFDKCGGCAMRHIDYDKIMEIKKDTVETTLGKALGRNVSISEVIQMENPLYYRNKLQFPVGYDKDNNPVMGVFRERTHEIIPTTNCLIQDKESQEIANFIIDFIRNNNIKVYNEVNGTGTIRHIIVRIGKKTGEIMVNLVTNETIIPHEKELVEELVSKFNKIKTVVKNINNKNTNVILGDTIEVLYGDGYIYDNLGDYRFKISPYSFYQVNPIQTEKLYGRAIEYAGLSGDETIFDLFCGIGTIGIFASKNVKKLYGIETIKEAIEDAKENARINNVENAEFFVGDVEKVLPELVKERNLTADVAFVDPPRKGCDIITINTLLEIMPKKIVYVSCNPATLGRDLKVFEEKYNISKISICDMFPYTTHIESICLLELR